MDRGGWIWGELRESCPAPVAGSLRFAYLVHNDQQGLPALWTQLFKQFGRKERHARCPATGLLPFEHSRQPDESWWSIRYVTCRWSVVCLLRSSAHQDAP